MAGNDFLVAVTKSGCELKVVPAKVLELAARYERQQSLPDRFGPGHMLSLSVQQPDRAPHLPGRVDVYLDEDAELALVDALGEVWKRKVGEKMLRAVQYAFEQLELNDSEKRTFQTALILKMSDVLKFPQVEPDINRLLRQARGTENYDSDAVLLTDLADALELLKDRIEWALKGFDETGDADYGLTFLKPDPK